MQLQENLEAALRRRPGCAKKLRHRYRCWRTVECDWADRRCAAQLCWIHAFEPGLFDLTDGDQFGDDDVMFSALTIDQDGRYSDELYRLVIKAKIVKNNGDATIESILDGMNFLLPTADVLRVTDGEDMSFSIEFYGQITDLERFALLNAGLVPKPQAVKFNGFLEGFDMVEFGDMDAEFGDEYAEFAGYIGA